MDDRIHIVGESVEVSGDIFIPLALVAKGDNGQVESVVLFELPRSLQGITYVLAASKGSLYVFPLTSCCVLDEYKVPIIDNQRVIRGRDVGQ